MALTRNVFVLATAQGLAAAGMTVMPVLGAIVGTELAARASLATLPVSLSVVGLAIATVPAALIMRRIGRRAGFIGSALFAAGAALLASGAIVVHSFALFCVAGMLLGANVAFTLQYRFAAAESVAAPDVSRAVSTIMLGTLAAAVIGPEIALASRNAITGHEFAGSFAAVAAVYVVAAMILTQLRSTGTAADRASHEPARPMRVVLTQPCYLVAVCAGIVSYAVMTFIMTATPISMHVVDGHGVDDTAWVIQSHLLAMYLPSLVSGRIVARFGTRRTMVVGTLLMMLCVGIASGGHHLMHYWWGLVLLGVGWNLLFVAGTTLLTTTYRVSERYRAQAVNEFAIFGLQAAASLLAGFAIAGFGWELLNFAVLPVLAAMLIAARWAQPSVSRNSAM
jgi:MFS family permease